jgi:hypothetical protein
LEAHRVTELDAEPFFRLDPGDPVLGVLRCVRALRAEGTPPGSVGAVQNVLVTVDEQGSPARLGPRADEVFGPAGGPSPERWGHVELSGGVVHPALAPAIAGCLSLDEPTVWALAYHEAWLDAGVARALPPDWSDAIGQQARALLAEHDRTGVLPEALVHPERLAPGVELTAQLLRSGPAHLRALLAGVGDGPWPARLRAAGFSPVDLIVDLVPVVPLSWRPLVDADGGGQVPGPGDVRYQDLLAASHLLRLSDGNALAHRALQTAFEVLYLQFASRGDRLAPHRRGVAYHRHDVYAWPDGVEAPRFSPPVVEEALDDARSRRPAGVTAVAFAGGRGLVCFPFATLLVDLEGGRVLRAHACGGLALEAVNARGTHALFRGVGAFHVLDLEAGRWVEEAPDDLPLWDVEVGADGISLHDLRRGARRRLHEVEDALGAVVAAPGHRYLLVEDVGGEGGIYRAGDGLLQAHARTLRRGAAEGPSALALARGRWRVFQDGCVRDLGDPPRRVAKTRIAAFDEGGERLLLATARELVCLELGAAPVERRFALSPLAPWLTLSTLPRLDAGRRRALLLRFGWLGGVAAATEAELASVPGIDERRAAALRAACLDLDASALALPRG